jgi:hypothetical protein
MITIFSVISVIGRRGGSRISGTGVQHLKKGTHASERRRPEAPSGVWGPPPQKKLKIKVLICVFLASAGIIFHIFPSCKKAFSFLGKMLVL